MKNLIFTLLFIFACSVFSFAKNYFNGDHTCFNQPPQTAAAQVIITEIMYNNPGADDYEYVELYNNGNEAANMTGWAFTQGILFTFPAFTLNPGDYIVIARDSVKMLDSFNITAFRWVTGQALNNTGETIVLKDNGGNVMDTVAYSASAPWPTAPNGQGPSLVLCDYNSNNNNPANWKAAVTPTGVILSSIEVLANPGAASACPVGPVIGFLNSEFTLLESAGNVFVRVTLSNGNNNPTQVTVQASSASTSTPGMDHNFTAPVTLTFPAGAVLDTQTVTITLIDDMDIESIETLVLELVNPTNSGVISPNPSLFTINIVDNDSPPSNALLITGIFDTQPSGAGVKGVELKAIANIPDLSIYGLGSANNGGGSGGVEVTLPAGSVTAGECIYVVTNSMQFTDFFGTTPNVLVVSGAANINGDDAIELFENSIVIDVFGDINMSGTGTPWEYLDGWAYRVSGTGPDGSIFNLNNWTFSGINALDNVANNASAPIPFPYCTYSTVAPTTAVANDDNATTSINTAVNINVLVNDVLPNPLTTMTVISQASSGTAVANGLTNITYTPNTGFCGTDAFTYRICDAMGCDNAIVNVTVNCPSTYPQYNISVVTTVTPNGGQPDSLGKTCQLKGIVHGVDLNGAVPVQFYLIDATGGISVFSNNNYGYTVTEGDEVIVRGAISQFNCLTQITPDTLWKTTAGNPLVTPALTTFLDESFESELLRINNLTLVNASEWTGTGTGFNVQVTNGASTYSMRIDNDVDLYSMPAPVGPFHAIGLGSQFDNDGFCDGGYQFLPRYKQDLILLTDTKEELSGQKILLYPNPVNDRLFIKTEVKINAISIANMLGQRLTETNNPGNFIDVSELKTGIYLITFKAGEVAWTTRFVKN